MTLKKISSLFFALAFICALFVFTDYGYGIISKSTAKIGMIAAGAIAILLNLLAFRTEPKEESNLFFWIGSVIVFVGLIFKIMHYPMNQLILLVGLLVTGISFFYNPFSSSTRTSDDDLLDQ